MIALYILLGIFALAFALCLIKLRFTASYDEKLRLELSVLFLKFTLLPTKGKLKKSKKKDKKIPQKKKDGEDKKKKKPSTLKKLSDKKGVDGLLSMFVELSQLATSTLKKLFERVVIEKLDVNIKVVGEDAADTALKYGKLCGVFYSAVAVVCGVCKCESYNLNVTPDFDDEAKAEVKAYSSFYIRVFYVLKYALSALVKLLIIRYKNR